jgi:ABC-2 type transport system permease protein
LRSPRPAWLWLVEKEWRQLVASRSWWVLLIAMGPLVGVSFISAVHSYAEVSGLGGTSAGVGEALAPLVGVWAPTFSACEIAAVFLLPFVVIRIVGGDRQSGALKLELQHRLSGFARVASKALVLLAGWLIASLAPLCAIVLWMSYSGTIYAPELATLALGHLLNAGLTIALASSAASLTEHPSTAAILTLSVTVGTWIINFAAAVQGGVWEQVAAYTPTAMVSQFQHGLLRMDLLLIALVLIGGGLCFAGLWMQIGKSFRRRVVDSLLLGSLTALALASSARINLSWDTSENRMNSFSRPDEWELGRIHSPLRIDAHLAPEDPRRADLEGKVLSKLRRVMPGLQVHYTSATSIGLFEQTSAHYGELWYDLGGRKSISRVTTEDGVLEEIYALAGVSRPSVDGKAFRGHPLAATPKFAAALFYGIWPAVFLASGILIRKRSL